ncbi:hypothetical protein LP421_27795 [Rhizobium sp. RCAM05350]|nr:hypothetical protein LP421_27795 [Rhizobium sp. RCAM05350]
MISAIRADHPAPFVKPVPRIDALGVACPHGVERGEKPPFPLPVRVEYLDDAAVRPGFVDDRQKRFESLVLAARTEAVGEDAVGKSGGTADTGVAMHEDSAVLLFRSPEGRHQRAP